MGTEPGRVGAQWVPRALGALHPGCVDAQRGFGASAAASHRLTWAPVRQLLGDPLGRGVGSRRPMKLLTSQWVPTSPLAFQSPSASQLPSPLSDVYSHTQ